MQKILDFYLMKCPGATTWRFRRFLGKNGPVWRFFDLKNYKNTKKFQKILNRLKIIVEQKEKRFWKAFCPNKLIGYQNI